MNLFLITALFGTVTFTYAIMAYTIDDAIDYASVDNPMADTIAVCES